MTSGSTIRDLAARLSAADQQIGAGNLEAAGAMLAPLLAEAPSDPDVLRLVGITHALGGQPGLALPFLVQSVNARCTWETASALLRVLTGLGRWADIAAFGEAARNIFAGNPLFLNTWGVALVYLERFEDAVPVLARAMTLAPGQRSIPHNLADALNRLGRKEEAVEAFSRSASPWTAGGAVQPPAALREAYARLSAHYDDKQLHQSFSQRIIHYLGLHAPDHAPGRVLELGCGTGLLAARLPAGVAYLAGIDQSPEMLAVARSRNAYHRLVEGDLVAVMAELTETFDTIIASCVLYHLADLAPVFAQVARLLSPGGVFAFSTDPMADGTDIGETTAGEYCHSRAYLRRVARQAGLAEAGIHIDVHRGPPGFWCSFRKAWA